MGDRIPYRACPLCDGAVMQKVTTADCSGHPLYKPQINPVIAWVRCENCGHVFTDGYFTPEALSIVFSSTQSNQQVGADMERQRLVSAKIVDRVSNWKASGEWLDIGFGNGSLLFTADEFGFKPVGVDLRRENVKTLEKFGIEAHCCVDITEFSAPGRFSVISLADVLEHMPFPRKALTAVAGLLKDDGILFLSMPNMDSMIWRGLDHVGQNPYWAEIEHYHNFGRKRLASLLGGFGFEVIHYAVSERYRACMELIARRAQGSGSAGH
jgi:2-polyprenyl-3-methyl-5-hydroxy-6-metoxy-1,4-benzoquinol methylase